jgi:hypothetical protein
MKLLTSNKKLEKTVNGEQYLVLGLALAPHLEAGLGVNMCPWAGECVKTCIWKSGLNILTSAVNSKIEKTRLFVKEQEQFKLLLIKEIGAALKRSNKQDVKLAVRLNLYSDVLWERVFPELFTMFPSVQFYDYTKAPISVRRALPPNYYLSYSFSEKTTDQVFIDTMKAGRNIVAVFDGQELPNTWNGYEVIDGDKHDLRFLDKKGVIVGLRPKRGLGKIDSAFKQQRKAV